MEYAEEVLPSLIPRANMIDAPRMEETSAWRHPVDLAGLLTEVYSELDGLIAEGGGRLADWQGHEELAEQIMDGSPRDTLSEMAGLVRQGAPLTELSAAWPTRRPAGGAFPGDQRVLRLGYDPPFVYLRQRRGPGNEAGAFEPAGEGDFDGAMSVYLERFLNVPKQAIPRPWPGSATEDLLQAFDGQGQVDDTALVAADMIARGRRTNWSGPWAARCSGRTRGSTCSRYTSRGCGSTGISRGVPREATYWWARPGS